MAYMRKIKNREGREYAYLVEGYRIGDKVRSRTLRNFGPLDVLEKDEPGIYERLKLEAKAGLLFEPEMAKIDIAFDLDKEITSDEQNYGWKILDGIFEGLAIPKFIKKSKNSKSKMDLTQLLKLLVFQRALNPASKISTCKSQEGLYGKWEVDENAIYRGLDELNVLKDELQLHLHNEISKTIGRSATLVFYDVTNYYFETDIDDKDEFDKNGTLISEGLRRRGPSKEHRPKPIVQLGLFMDENAIPISYKLFRGNQTDPITYLPAIEQVKKLFGIKRVVVVADKAMNSKNNVSTTLKNGDGWLFSQKHRGIRGASKQVQNFILDQENWLFNESMTFATKSTIMTRVLADKTQVQEKVVVIWRKTYADREKIRRDGALEYAEKLTNAELFRQTAKRGGKKYLELFSVDKSTGEKKPFSPIIKIDYDMVAFDAQFDGVNVLVTSEINMSDEEIIANYGQLSKIEDCFRVTKTDLSARPVYVWKKERIEAHFLICFLALVHIRVLQHCSNWQLSPARLIEALNSAKANELTGGFHRVQASEDLKALQKTLGIDWTKAIVKSEKLNSYAKGWFTTQKK